MLRQIYTLVADVGISTMSCGHPGSQGRGRCRPRIHGSRSDGRVSQRGMTPPEPPDFVLPFDYNSHILMPDENEICKKDQSPCFRNSKHPSKKYFLCAKRKKA